MSNSLTLWAIPYRHKDGRQYTIDVYATDADDARQRIRSAYFQGEYPEQIVARVQAPGWLAKMMGVSQ